MHAMLLSEQGQHGEVREEGVVSLHRRRGLPLSRLPTGFAKKTFISYSVTFGDSFRQGKVVGIDPGRQQVLFSDGEVGVAMAWLPYGITC